MRTWIVISAALVGLAASGCSDDKDKQQDQGGGGNGTLPDGSGGRDAGHDQRPTALAYGAACSGDESCQSGMCVEGFCSKLCKALADCPATGGQGFDCGELEPGQIVCYPRRYSSEPMTVGANCSLGETCAVGYSCVGLEGTPDRYCTADCQGDRDCPPRYRCASVQTGLGEPVQQCRLREFCHPCAIDDHCGGAGDRCIKDINGNGYCSKSCNASGTTCPIFAKCEDAGNGEMQCKHRKGYCYKSLEGEGDLCDPCFIHGEEDETLAEANTCKQDAICYLISQYTMEAACLTPCADDAGCPEHPTIDYGCFSFSRYDDKKFCLPYYIEYYNGQEIPMPDTCYP